MRKYIVHIYNVYADTIHFSLEAAMEWLESTGRHGEVRLNGVALVAVLPVGTIQLKSTEEVWR